MGLGVIVQEEVNQNGIYSRSFQFHYMVKPKTASMTR
jgi:hypothetical protein